MARQMLYPDETPMVHRHSSIDQYKGFLSVWDRGGWSPIVFDQLDGIVCGEVKSHPIVISFGDDIGYHFDDATCSYASDHFITFDKEGVVEELLPACFGGGGETYVKYLSENTFLNFDTDDSVGVHNTQNLRVGTSYCLSDETLPAVD